MTFPLGSLRADGGAGQTASPGTSGRKGRESAAAPAGTASVTPRWRARLALGFGAVLWLLALLALATHSPADPAFTTSGAVAQATNKAGTLGAWFADGAYFVFGFSAWWLLLIGLLGALGALARVLRSEQPPAAPVDPHEPPAWLFWVGIVVLMAASCALESTRLYQFEARVAMVTFAAMATLLKRICV